MWVSVRKSVGFSGVKANFQLHLATTVPFRPGVQSRVTAFRPSRRANFPTPGRNGTVVEGNKVYLVGLAKVLHRDVRLMPLFPEQTRSLSRPTGLADPWYRVSRHK
jgi:hypothetical protein